MGDRNPIPTTGMRVPLTKPKPKPKPKLQPKPPPTFSSFKKPGLVEGVSSVRGEVERQSVGSPSGLSKKRRERSSISPNLQPSQVNKRRDKESLPAPIRQINKKLKQLDFFPEYLTREFGAYLNTEVDSHYKEFGTFQQSRVPKFKLYGDGQVIGLDPNWRLSKREGPTGKYFHPASTSSYDKSLRYFNCPKLPPRLVLKPKSEYLEHPYVSAPSFIELDDKLEEVDLSTSALEDQSELDLVGREKTRFYETLVKENPNDIPTWLEYIEFQAKHNSFSSKNRHVKNTIKADIQMAMFERAMELNPDSEVLLQKYLQCCQITCNPSALLSKWDDILKRHPNSSKLWLQYLNYRLTEHAGFNIPSVIQDFGKCMSSLGGMTGNSDDLAQLKVLDGLTRFLRDSGYSEMATCLYQAVFEFNFFSPFENGKISLHEKVQAFQEFWDKEWPRFGEDGAIGWNNFYDRTVIPNFNPNYDSDNFVPANNFEIQLEDERNYDILHHFTIKSQHMDFKTLLDPNRVVLFEDVAPFLISLKTEHSKIKLIDLFISFTILPSYSITSTNSNIIASPLIYNDLILNGLVDKMFCNFSTKNIPEKLDLIYGIYVSSEPVQVVEKTYPIKNCPVHTIDLTKPSNIQHEFNSRLQEASYRNFIDNCMRSILEIPLTLPKALLSPALVYFSLINSTQLSKMKLTFKLTLNQYSDSIELYLARGTLLYEDKELGEARKLFSEVSSFCRNHKTNPPISSLYRTWIDLEFLADCISLTKALIISYAFAKELQFQDSSFIYHTVFPEEEFGVSIEIFNTHDPPVDPKGTLSDLLGYLDHIHIHAIATLILNGMEACQRVYENVLIKLESASSEVVEFVFTRYVSLLSAYMNQNRGFKPALIRKVLERALQKFPANSVFLNGYLQLEKRFRFAGRLRGYINRILNSTPSCSLWLFAIFVELNQSPGQKSLQAIEDTFEKALDCPTTRGAASLWVLYIEYQLRLDSYQDAILIFKRAIFSCPYSKELYLYGLAKLHPHLEVSQREEFLHMLMEQELRTRVLV